MDSINEKYAYVIATLLQCVTLIKEDESDVADIWDIGKESVHFVLFHIVFSIDILLITITTRSVSMEFA